jgi:hypothetical protein
MAQNNIVFITSSRQGAPSLTGQANSLNNVLYQVLCTGFNSQSSVSLSSAAGIATATKNNHGFVTYDWVLVSGATNNAYNGMQQVLDYTATNFTFAVAGAPGADSGTVCFAPAGWVQIYSASNRMAFQGDDQSSGLILYVDDSGVNGTKSYRNAWACGYESWNINTGVNPWPTVAQLANGVAWCKSTTLDGTARPWWLVGDGKRFYVGIAWDANSTGMYDVFCFGDYLPTIAGNAFPGYIIGSSSEIQSSIGTGNLFGALVALANTSAGKYLCRKYDSTGSALACGMIGNNTIAAYLGYGGITGVNLPTNGIELQPIDFHCGGYLYSPLPGAYQMLHNAIYNNYDILPTFPELPGRRLLVLTIAVGAGNSAIGRLVLDITGPWKPAWL